MATGDVPGNIARLVQCLTAIAYPVAVSAKK